jgi:hypothetical protein
MNSSTIFFYSFALLAGRYAIDDFIPPVRDYELGLKFHLNIS